MGERRWSAPSTAPVIHGGLPPPTLGDDHPVEAFSNTHQSHNPLPRGGETVTTTTTGSATPGPGSGSNGLPTKSSLHHEGTTRTSKHVTIVLPQPSPLSEASESQISYLNFSKLSTTSSSAYLEDCDSTPDYNSNLSREPSPRQAKTLVLLGMSYAACSGTLSGMCLLFAKCAVELLILTFGSHGSNNQFKHFQSWILVAGLVVAALAQLFYLNHSLRLAGPALICPLAFCFYNISSIFG